MLRSLDWYRELIEYYIYKGEEMTAFAQPFTGKCIHGKEGAKMDKGVLTCKCKEDK